MELGGTSAVGGQGAAGEAPALPSLDLPALQAAVADAAAGQGWEAILPLLAALAAEAPVAPRWQLPEPVLVDVLLGLERVQRQLGSARLALVAEADARGVAASAGAPSTGAWLRERLRIRPGEAFGALRLARELADHRRVAALLDEGSIAPEHARAIIAVLRDLPDDVSAEAREEALETLLEHAQRFDPRDLERLGQAMLAMLDPDGKPPTEERERRNEARRDLSWNRRSDGSLKVWGTLSGEGAAVLLAALDPLSAPRPADPDEVIDPRTGGQRRADALVALARLALDNGSLPESGGERPHVGVTVSLATLRREAAAAQLDGTGSLSAEAARRWACDASVIPIVLGGASQPLDVGRATRVVPTGMRRGLVARDRGCAFPGCDRRPDQCDAHHVQHWADGGPTSLANLVLLCGHHHRRIHHDQWRVRAGADGRPEFAPPGQQFPATLPPRVSIDPHGPRVPQPRHPDHVPHRVGVVRRP